MDEPTTEKTEEHNGKPGKKGLPTLPLTALWFHGAAVIAFILASLLMPYAWGIALLLLVFVPIAVIIGIILGITGLFMFKFVGSIGIVMSVLAIFIPILPISVFIFLQANGVIIIAFM